MPTVAPLRVCENMVTSSRYVTGKVRNSPARCKFRTDRSPRDCYSRCFLLSLMYRMFRFSVKSFTPTRMIKLCNVCSTYWLLAFVPLALFGCSTYQNLTAYFNTYYNVTRLYDEAVAEAEA